MSKFISISLCIDARDHQTPEMRRLILVLLGIG